MENILHLLEGLVINGQQNDGFQTKKGKKGKTQTLAGPTLSEIQELISNTTMDQENVSSVLKTLLMLMLKLVENQISTKQIEEMQKDKKLTEEKVSKQEEKIKIQEKKLQDQEAKIRAQSDNLDEINQRNLKGNLILTSPQQGGKQSLLKSPDTLDKEGKTVVQHTIDLIKTKYGVEIPQEDIQACHHLPNSGGQKKPDSKPEHKAILIRIWNRKQGSAWSLLVNKILQGGNSSVNLYANFHLTAQRNSLLYHLRQLKKANKIYKFYTSENGGISYRTNEKAAKKIITYHADKPNSLPKTTTPEELQKLFN